MSDWATPRWTLMPHPEWGRAGASGDLELAGLNLLVESVVTSEYHYISYTFSTCCGTAPDPVQIKRRSDRYRSSIPVRQYSPTVPLTCEACKTVFDHDWPLMVTLSSKDGILTSAEEDILHELFTAWLDSRENDPLECEIYSSFLMDETRRRYREGWAWAIAHD